MKFSQIPNILSILRILLVIPIVILLFGEHYLLALFVFFIAGISDGLDGWIAKRFGYQSHFGSIIDPLADKILLVSSFLILFWLMLMPVWLILLVILRDVMIVAAMVGYYYESAAHKKELLSPSNLSKVNTILQISAILATLLAQLYPSLSYYLNALYIVVATSTTLSGMDYAWLWIKRMLLNQRQF